MTAASPQKRRPDSESYVSGLFDWYISNPGQGGATARKITLRIFLFFIHITHKTDLIFIFCPNHDSIINVVNS